MFCRGDAWAGGSAGSQQQQGPRLPSVGRWGWGGRGGMQGVFSIPRALLSVGRRAVTALARSRSRSAPGEPSSDLRQQRTAAPKVYSSRKINSLGKKPQPFGRFSLCRSGAVEKLSLGRGTNPSTPVSFRCLTHVHPFTEIRDARENLYAAHLCWMKSQAVKCVPPAPSCWKEAGAGRQEVSWWVAGLSEQESLKGRFFGSPSLWRSSCTQQLQTSCYESHVSNAAFPDKR